MPVLQRREGLGSSILEALGLNQSGLPPELLQGLKLVLDQLFELNIRLVTQRKRCTAPPNPGETPTLHFEEEGSCCHLGDPRVWARTSAGLSVEVSLIVGSLSLSGSISADPQQPIFDREWVCPEECRDEVVELVVPVSYTFNFEIRGSVDVTDSSQPAALNMGPILGTTAVTASPLDTGSTAGPTRFRIGFGLRVDRTTYDNLRYIVDCEKIFPIEAEASGEQILIGLYGASVPNDSEYQDRIDGRRGCQIKVQIVGITGSGVDPRHYWTMDFDVNGVRNTIFGQFDAGGRFVQSTPSPVTTLFNGLLPDKCVSSVRLPISLVATEDSPTRQYWTADRLEPSLDCQSTSPSTKSERLTLRGHNSQGGTVPVTVDLRLEYSCKQG